MPNNRKRTTIRRGGVTTSPPPKESGYKWWIQNCLVPILSTLTGGGGLIAIVLGLFQMGIIASPVTTPMQVTAVAATYEVIQTQAVATREAIQTLTPLPTYRPTSPIIPWNSNSSKNVSGPGPILGAPEFACLNLPGGGSKQLCIHNFIFDLFSVMPYPWVFFTFGIICLFFAYIIFLKLGRLRKSKF